LPLLVKRLLRLRQRGIANLLAFGGSGLLGCRPRRARLQIVNGSAGRRKIAFDALTCLRLSARRRPGFRTRRACFRRQVDRACNLSIG
jgi:hypothetical protein